MKRPVLYYLHGFNSSPQSAKAQRMQQWLAHHHPLIECRIPCLPYDPESVVSQVMAMLNSEAEDVSVGLVGSSLGGFYASYFACALGCPAVLINPAFKPHILLKDFLGWNENYHTGERHQFTEAHVQLLESMAPSAQDLRRAHRQLFLITQTGDEVLDYRTAMQSMQGSRAWIQPGGDHGFVAFDRVLPAILAFLLPQLR